MIDKWPAWARHLFFAITPAVLGWIASDVVPALENQGPQAALVASLVTVLVAAVTPLTTQYGIGKKK